MKLLKRIKILPFAIITLGIHLLIQYINKQNILNNILPLTTLIILVYLFIRNKRIQKYNHFDLTIDNFNKSFLTFASFLDEFKENHASLKKAKIHLNNNINILIENYCSHCNKSQICFNNKKVLVYQFLKNSLIEGLNISIKNQSKELINFLRSCNYSKEIINTAQMIKKRENLRYENNSLNTILDGLSQVVKNVVMDENHLKNKEYLQMFSLLNKLNNIVTILDYEIKVKTSNQYTLELLISGNISLKMKKIKHIANKILKTQVFVEINNNRIKIFKKHKYNITYSCSNIAKEGHFVGGDNYLINESKGDTSFLIALSDGMGHGYDAYNESRNTLSLVEKLSKMNIENNTVFNILNTFYQLKDNQDIYATLDYAEICKVSGKLEIFKMGSAQSYIIKDDHTINKIENNNLPLGIDQLVMNNNYTLKNNDVLALFSDGITDLINEEELKQVLLDNIFKTPQEIVYELLSKSVMPKDYIKDDISVVIIKVSELKQQMEA